MNNSTFYEYEKSAAENGLILIGADEAGRGPLAGPVVAAAVAVKGDFFLEGIDDSKKLTEKKREDLYPKITSSVLAWNVGIVDVDVIEKINILNATRLAFKTAIEGLNLKKEDVKLVTDYITGLDLSIPYEAIVKGDAKVYSIAAASILAKVTRDRIMREYDKQYPEYGFAGHKGYGSKAHCDAIKRFGPCPIHRMSFLGKILGEK